MGSYELGPYYCANPHHALLHEILDGLHPAKGVALEFGVGHGDSLRCIADWMPVYGFDSFEGLPEDWRPGFDKGAFRYDYQEVSTDLPPNARLVRGLFEDTLPAFCWDGMRDIALIHIDCDLYSSTKTVLENLPWPKMLRPRAGNKTVIIFDEWWGYPEAEQHEQRAWREFTSREPYDRLDWKVVGHGVQQWGIQLV